MPKRNNNEWLMQMKHNLKCLEDFTYQYDAGKIEYAIEMSAKLRILLENKSKEGSLLNNFCSVFSFNLPDFLDYSIFNTHIPNEMTTKFVRCNLCGYKFIHDTTNNSRNEYLYPIPIFKLAKVTNLEYRFKSYKTWWERTTAISLGEIDINNKILHRREIVRLICDKNGGTHVDPNLSKALTLLLRNEDNPVKTEFNGILYSAKLDDILYATIRQISYETLKTLKPLVHKIESQYTCNN